MELIILLIHTLCFESMCNWAKNTFIIMIVFFGWNYITLYLCNNYGKGEKVDFKDLGGHSNPIELLVGSPDLMPRWCSLKCRHWLPTWIGCLLWQCGSCALWALRSVLSGLLFIFPYFHASDFNIHLWLNILCCWLYICYHYHKFLSNIDYKLIINIILAFSSNIFILFICIWT